MRVTRMQHRRNDGTKRSSERAASQLSEKSLDKSFSSECEITTTHRVGDFKCPACSETALPPIYQCAQGHIICSRCRTDKHNTLCPFITMPGVTCRYSMHGGIRNRYLEKVVNQMILKCRYHKAGCKVRKRGEVLGAHEKECQFRPFTCSRFKITGSCGCGCVEDGIEERCDTEKKPCQETCSSVEKFIQHWNTHFNFPVVTPEFNNGIVKHTIITNAYWQGSHQEVSDKQQYGHCVNAFGHTFCFALYLADFDDDETSHILQLVPTILGTEKDARGFVATVRVNGTTRQSPENQHLPPPYIEYANVRVQSIRSHAVRDDQWNTFTNPSNTTSNGIDHVELPIDHLASIGAVFKLGTYSDKIYLPRGKCYPDYLTTIKVAIDVMIRRLPST